MTEFLVFSGIAFIAVYGSYMRHKHTMLGREEQRLENAEETIENVEKANTVEHDDTYDRELLEKYNK